MKEIILVLGGCRSGKSHHALHLAEQLPGQKIFIATCIPQDKEMEQRVLHHQRQRNATWKTLEVPIFLPEAIDTHGLKGNVLIADCLTLWINNLVMKDENPANIDTHIQNLIRSLEKSECPVVLVSNEVGCGIVPENELARRFRDITGFSNQKLAECADRVIWMVAGIPVKIK
ncbi:MAG: bifunctional adenosylcobinamide kinase/adenosylcobinamide-phosphate guanylyltransferase [Desulfobacterales bacterium]